MSDSPLELPKTIVIVEDDPAIQHMLRLCLQEASKVLVAGDGRRGFELVATERPDFVVTDLMLPELDGLQLIKSIRGTYYGACLPILVLTATSSHQILLDCFRQGADDFMVKPFSLAELRVRIASIYLRQQVARDMNPLTRLPGNMVIKQQIHQRLKRGRSFAIATLDLDHFKAFNDSRGFDAGDEAIRLVGRLLEEFTLEHPADDVWVGHIGGDDFIALMHPDQVPGFGAWIHDRFEAQVKRFYTDDELGSGQVTITNRAGKLEEVPLLSLSIGVVSTERADLNEFRRIMHVSAEVKRQAKAVSGNSIFIDRRSGDADLAG